MKILTPFLALATICLAATHFEPPEKQLPANCKPATIRVLLKKDAEGCLLEVKGPYQVYDPKTGKKLSHGRSGKRFFLYPHDEGIKWGENFLGIFQLRVVPHKAETSMLVNGVQYKGVIEIYHTGDKVSVVNEVNIENYIKSTMTPQFDKFYSDEVMEAVSIVSRTDSYSRVLQNREALWHVTAEESGYTGYGATLVNPEIERSVDNTRFLVMTLDALPFSCTWTGNCAGKTANYATIFRKDTPTPSGINAVFAKEARADHHWSLSVEKSKIAMMAKTNRVGKIEIFAEKESSKVYALRVHDGIHSSDLDFFTLQESLGKDSLPSNDFTVSLQGDYIIFDGYGEGNGTGLCLFSAGKMNIRGDSVPDILATFFPFSHLEKMPAFPDAKLSSNDNRVIIPSRVFEKMQQEMSEKVSDETTDVL